MTNEIHIAEPGRLYAHSDGAMPNTAAAATGLPKLLYTREEVAEFLSVKPTSIDWYRRKGTLPYRKLGRKVRFAIEDLRAFAETGKVPATVTGAAATQKGDE